MDRDLYSKFDWEEMLIASLEEGFPLYYSGSDDSGGHAFACCGYRESDRKFYFNWGWSGSLNNYYAIDALNTGWNGSFNQGQAAIFDYIPDYVYNGLIPAVEDLLGGAQFQHQQHVVQDQRRRKPNRLSVRRSFIGIGSRYLTHLEQQLRQREHLRGTL